MSETVGPMTRPNTLPAPMQAVVAHAPGGYRPAAVDVPRAGLDDRGGRPGDGR